MGILAGQVLTEADLVGLGEWIAYTSTVAGVTIGNGTIDGRYIRQGDKVTAEVLISLGTTSSVAGPVTFTVPTPAAKTKMVGCGLGRVTSTGNSYVLTPCAVALSSTISIRTVGTAGLLGDISNAAPGTWGTGGWILVQVTYEAA